VAVKDSRKLKHDRWIDVKFGNVGRRSSPR
jgi:hypothetical protein